MVTFFTAFFLLSNSFAAEKPAVLITSFLPFGKNTRNISQYVALQLNHLLTPHADVTLCALPVYYDKAAEVALDCYKNMPQKPFLVLSLGQGDSRSPLTWEQTAIDIDDHPEADEQGEVRVATPQVQNHFSYLKMSLFTKLKKNIPHHERDDAQFSSYFDHKTQKFYIGTFVCNNTAYRMAHAFTQEKQPPLYGFIHVPQKSDDSLSLMIESQQSAQSIYEKLLKLFK